MAEGISPPYVDKDLFTAGILLSLDAHIVDFFPADPWPSVKHQPLAAAAAVGIVMETHFAACPEASGEVLVGRVVSVCAVGGEFRCGCLEGEVD